MPGPTSRFDLGNALVVDLLSGTLESVTDLTLFGGANALAVETAPGNWEIVQAGAAELIAPGRYRLTRLLRGQRGTEAAMGNPTPAGARVVVLDSALASAADRRGRSRSAVELAHRPRGAAGQRRELHRAGLHASRSRPRALRSGPCRAAVAHGTQPGRSDDPLDAPVARAGGRCLGTGRGAAGRGPESYDVQILDGAAVKRTLTSTTTSVLYTAAQQTADWGAPLGPGQTLAIRIYQLSNRLGRGAPADRHPPVLKARSCPTPPPILALPYLLAAQAQKHVTHNEALRLLDAMVQLSVLDRTRTTPPASPADGDRHLVASGATGLWAGWDLNVAFWVDGVWLRLVPRPGWLVWIAAEQVFVVWNGSRLGSGRRTADVSDAIFSLVNDADPTKKALFSLSGITTGTTRTFTLPNTSSELAILAGTQTFTGNKTFSGTLTASGTVTVSAASASIGTATTTATYGMGTGATTTGVTKTVNLGTGGASGSTTVVNIGSATAGAGGTTVVNTPTVTFANAVTQVGMPQANLTAQLLGLGGATADSYNRVSVNTPALLFNNAGAGIEATVNKAAAGNDAAFAFKTGFSARALIGLLGQ